MASGTIQIEIKAERLATALDAVTQAYGRLSKALDEHVVVVREFKNKPRQEMEEPEKPLG